MHTTVEDRLALNATGSRVDADIRRYLGSLAGRSSERFCYPSLAAIARAAWTSPIVVKKRLQVFESEGSIIPVVREIGGERVVTFG